MPRYIDADTVVKMLDEIQPFAGNKATNAAINLCKDIVRNAPTVSTDEVRGVVHCKDCKWCHAGYCEKYDDLIPFGCANKPWEDWFCADGKRREAKKEAQDAD